MRKMNYWISLSYATFSITVSGGVVTDAAPIARWMIGKKMLFIENWVKKKGGDMVCLGLNNPKKRQI